MISGNSDTTLLRYRNGKAPKEWNDNHQFALLRLANKNIDEITIKYLQSLPDQCSIQISDKDAIRVVHGSPRDQYESIFPKLEPETLEIALAQTEEPVFICGHTHIPWKVERDGILAFNPGAVCGPLNGQICAQYAILNWDKDHWQVEHRTVDYDLDLIRAAFHNSGLLHEGGTLARCFLQSIETGQNITERFLNHAYRMAEQAGFGEMNVIPDDVWVQADETFDWECSAQPRTTYR